MHGDGKYSIGTRILEDVYPRAVVGYLFVAAWFRDLEPKRSPWRVAIIEIDLEFQIGLAWRAHDESAAAGKVAVQVVAGVEHAAGGRATRRGDAVITSRTIATQGEEGLVVAGAKREQHEGYESRNLHGATTVA